MLFALDICVNKNAPPTYSVDWGLNPPPPPTSTPQHLLLTSPILNLQTIQSPLLGDPPRPKKTIYSSTPPLPPKKIKRVFQ